MTYRIRNIIIAVGLALVAMMLTLFYVTNYKRSVQHGASSVQVYVAAHDVPVGTTGADLVKKAIGELSVILTKEQGKPAGDSQREIEHFLHVSCLDAGPQVGAD